MGVSYRQVVHPKACLGHVAQQAYYTQPNHHSQNDIVPPTLALDEAQ